MGLIGFVVALGLGLYGITLALTAVLTAAPLLLLIRASYRSRVSADVNTAISGISRATTNPNRWHFIYFLFYAAVAISMWLIFQRALLEQTDGMYTGVLNNYGDLPFHISVITRFAYGQNFPPEDPTFAGVRFTYPFITDFISAIFVRAGASLRHAMFLENYIIAVALVGVLHRFGQRLVRNRTAAIITPLLILLNGGFGWALLWDDVKKIEGGVFQVLRHIPHSYTILPEIEKAWRWGNSITSLLVTQRGFLLGIPLAVIVFTLWWTVAASSEEGKRQKAKGKKGSRPKKTCRPSRSKRSHSLRRFFLFPFPFAFRKADARRRRHHGPAAADSRAQFHFNHAGRYISGALDLSARMDCLCGSRAIRRNRFFCGGKLRCCRFATDQDRVRRHRFRTYSQPLVSAAATASASLALLFCHGARRWFAANLLVNPRQCRQNSEFHRLAIWVGQRSGGDVWIETCRVTTNRDCAANQEVGSTNSVRGVVLAEEHRLVHSALGPRVGLET